MPDAAPTARGACKPRRPQPSPLFRVVSDHLQRLQTVYDERLAGEYGPWRPVVAQVADRFLACGMLDHGFARIRCDDCAHAYLLAFSCKRRYFCPGCHARRLARWTQWLETTLLAPVPHRQVVRTIPRRLRACCLCRRLLGQIAGVAARTLTAASRTPTGERDLAVGIVACPQTHAGTFGVGGSPTGATDCPPPASLPPTAPAIPPALEAPERAGGHAATRQSVLVRAVIASYTQPTLIEILIPRPEDLACV